jgi:hypothetical protein
MLLAQATATTDFTLDCAAIGGVITLVISGVRGFYSDRAKARRDSEQTDALHNIANSNAKIETTLVAQNGKLSAVNEINRIYHDEVLRVLKECPLKQSK